MKSLVKLLSSIEQNYSITPKKHFSPSWETSVFDTKTILEVAHIQTYGFKYCFLNQSSPATFPIAVTNRSEETLRTPHDP